MTFNKHLRIINQKIMSVMHIYSYNIIIMFLINTVFSLPFPHTYHTNFWCKGGQELKVVKIFTCASHGECNKKKNEYPPVEYVYIYPRRNKNRRKSRN